MLRHDVNMSVPLFKYRLLNFPLFILQLCERKEKETVSHVSQPSGSELVSNEVTVSCLEIMTVTVSSPLVTSSEEVSSKWAFGRL